MANVSLININKTYPSGTKAVNDFSLEIKDKEFLVLVGPSGCGKSTVLRIVAGLEKADSGKVLIDGKDVTLSPAGKRGAAMVFQNYALFKTKTVRQNIAFGLKGLSKDEVNLRVTQTAAMLGLTEFLDRKPKSLSGGQKQRVALGRALVCRPKVFLLDEPLSNLDAKLRTATRCEITEIFEKLNLTFIYVTHDQTEAMTMGNRIAVMDGGILQQADTPQNVYNYPANKFVAGFIGSPTINFIDASLKNEGGKHYVFVDGCKAQLSKEYAAKIPTQYFDGRTVCLGIRPADVLLGKNTGGLALKAAVTLIEETGGESYIYTCPVSGENQAGQTCKKEQIIVKTSAGHNVKKGDIITLSLDKSAFLFFDNETQKNIINF